MVMALDFYKGLVINAVIIQELKYYTQEKFAILKYFALVIKNDFALFLRKKITTISITPLLI